MPLRSAGSAASKTGLSVTLDVLCKTHNEAAVDLLLAALDNPDPSIRDGALEALLKRRTIAGHREIINLLPRLDARGREIVARHHRLLGRAIREALQSPEPEQFTKGAAATLEFRDYDMLPTLLQVAEDDANPHAAQAAQHVLKLGELLYESLAAGRNSQDRDPQLMRTHVLHSLEQSLARYSRHKRPEIVESFLLLAPRDHAILKQILSDPMHAAYKTTIDLLTNSPRGGVIRLALGFLDDPQTPSAAVHVIGRRSDAKFVEHLLRKIGSQPSALATQNLRRIDHISWLQGRPVLVNQFEDALQHSAVQLATASGLSKASVFKLIVHLLTEGKPGGRRAAAAALGGFNGAEANHLAEQAVHDSDPQVQAQVLPQLRQRGIAGALPILLGKLDNPFELVRNAARRSLDEFSFDRYLSAFDMLDDKVRQSTGPMVRKVDPTAPHRLLEEIQARSRTRRLRGIAMAATMNLALQLEAAVIERLSDEDHLVRAEAAKALMQCPTEEARQALKLARNDRSIVVQEAAERSLREFTSESLVDESFALALDLENTAALSAPGTPTLDTSAQMSSTSGLSTESAS